MEAVCENQFLVFLFSCLLGAGLGALYDVFRVIRILINPRNIAVFFQDIIYFLASGFITFVFVLMFNSGESRFYIVIGECTGWIIYHVTLGEFVYKNTRNIIKFINRKIKPEVQ